jgi:apurinic endonuclease APN1
LILETSAGAGGNIGGTFEELAELIKLSNDKRVKVCMDTAHVFASGVDLRTVAGVEKAITDFDNTIGLDKLVVVHANDSKVDFGSNRDRHENIGEGFIGQDELNADKITLKDMASGKSTLVTLDEAIKILSQ